jgi:putative addiction module CopG family antidote
LPKPAKSAKCSIGTLPSTWLQENIVPITLPQELDTFLQSEVAAGRYQSVDDAVRDAVERLRRHRSLDQLRQKIDAGLAAIDRGHCIDIETEEDEDRFFEQLLAKLPGSNS